jgi:hypothetical protein
MVPVSHIQKNKPEILQDNGPHQINKLSQTNIGEEAEDSP